MRHGKAGHLNWKAFEGAPTPGLGSTGVTPDKRQTHNRSTHVDERRPHGRPGSRTLVVAAERKP